jgi:hypothetical protein
MIGYPARRLPPLGGRLSSSVQQTLHLHLYTGASMIRRRQRADGRGAVKWMMF